MRELVVDVTSDGLRGVGAIGVNPLRATRAPRHELRIVRECATDEEISEHSSYDYDSDDYWH